MPLVPALLFQLAFTSATPPPLADTALVPPADAARTAIAYRAARAPAIDGRDDDAVWRTAVAITGFREFTPVEDKDPRFDTEARVAYDARNLYVFVRAFDTSPDSILTLLARRDIRTASDQIKVIVDSYHDRRSGYEFAVNPAGVKRDYAVYNDGNEDGAWDAVWDVATTVDSLGWTAEFRIPLSQMRFASAASNTFGFGIWRDIQRTSERVSWPLFRPSKTGFMSQLGDLTGLVGLASPRRLEVLPYGVARSSEQPNDVNGFDRTQHFSMGADVKYGLGSNMTLSATVNPDFGQVEADPAVLNLSAFETFFQERRPFFVEGSGIFDFSVNCNVVSCQGESLFYSRRIGRAPQLAGEYADASSPTASTILGAGKLTGRFPGGLTVGVVNAVTAREVGAQDRTIEPATNYAAVRLQQDFREGLSGVGMMLTAVNRGRDQWTEGSLRRDAYVAAVDFRHRFPTGGYTITGKLDLSRVGGTPAAIAATQRSAVHYYQRPDANLGFDPARTSLMGDAEELQFGKFSGPLRFETSYQRRSAGFEVNDLGYLRRADQQSWSTWAQARILKPHGILQQGTWNANWWQYWTTAGLPLERAFNTNVHGQLRNRWWIHAGGTLGQLGSPYCDRCSRGGPAIRTSPYLSAWSGIEGDDRRALVPFVWFSYWRGDGGRSRSVGISPELDLRVSTGFTTSVSLDLSHNRDDSQWYGNFADSTGATHYTFAHLEQSTAALTWRVNYTFTPNLSLQVYAQPFVSKGTYSSVREVADPRADAYANRFRAYDDQAVTADPGGFNVKQFHSNVVLRWEYLPGSSLFIVWAQGRSEYLPAAGDRSLFSNGRDLFALHADDTFLVKMSYWLNM